MRNDPIIFASRDPSPESINYTPIHVFMWFNTKTDQMFLRTPKGLVFIPTEYKCIHSYNDNKLS